MSDFPEKSMRKKQGFFSISAVAKMFAIHQQTIRLYEREGLINPKRSDGNTRLFSEDDVNKLEKIIYLTHKLGINLAGVQMVLKLQKQIKKMQKDMNQMFDATRKDLDKQEEEHKQETKHVTQQLIKLKEKKTYTDKQTDTQKNFDDNWEIEYDE